MTSVHLHQRLFFGIFSALFLELFQAIFPTGLNWFGEIVAAGAIGLLVADAVHWAMDGFPIKF
ncbi:MAG: hypothetical protein F6K42_12955 [Leptolyngbya sp. SIO1D8]|nr:hypothetical protein [Leptolyngbya sp. SIO1D8]